MNVNKSTQNKITIIIPSKRHDKNLSFCIKKIRQFYNKIKIFVILDKKEYFKKDKNVCLFISGNKSIGYKRNFGVKYCKTDYVCFIDSDAYPVSPWLDQVHETFKKFKRVGAIGGPNLSPPTNNIEKLLVSKSRKFSFVTLYPIVKTKEKKIFLIDFLPTSNLILKTKIYKKIGGMYEGLYAGEDISLIRNLRKQDLKIIFNPNIYIYHKDRNFKHFFRQRYIYGSVGLKLFILFPCKESFLLLISSIPFIYLLISPFFILNKFLLIFYLGGLGFLSTFILLYALKINYNKHFLKSLRLTLISIFAPGIGLILSFFLKQHAMKKLYTQK